MARVPDAPERRIEAAPHISRQSKSDASASRHCIDPASHSG
jgi:hypothetical protein